MHTYWWTYALLERAKIEMIPWNIYIARTVDVEKRIRIGTVGDVDCSGSRWLFRMWIGAVGDRWFARSWSWLIVFCTTFVQISCRSQLLECVAACWPLLQYCQVWCVEGWNRYTLKSSIFSPNLVLKRIDEMNFCMRNNLELKFNLEV